MSANKRVETLYDAQRHGFSIAVRCLRGHRRRILDTGALIAIWSKKGWSMRIGRLHEHLRCDGCRPVDVEVRATGEQPDHWGIRFQRPPEDTF